MSWVFCAPHRGMVVKHNKERGLNFNRPKNEGRRALQLHSVYCYEMMCNPSWISLTQPDQFNLQNQEILRSNCGVGDGGRCQVNDVDRVLVSLCKNIQNDVIRLNLLVNLIKFPMMQLNQTDRILVNGQKPKAVPIANWTEWALYHYH